jgi:hypothetical protein
MLLHVNAVATAVSRVPLPKMQNVCVCVCVGMCARVCVIRDLPALPCQGSKAKS